VTVTRVLGALLPGRPDADITQERYARWRRTTATRAEVMSFLIQGEWVTGEARTRGIEVTPERVRRAFRRQKRGAFESERQYRRYLRRSRLTQGQVLFRVKLDLLRTSSCAMSWRLRSPSRVARWTRTSARTGAS
jgi:hypothetical protein